MKKKIAFITNSYKAASEVWIWRQVQYLKSNIGYIGLFENTIENFYENIPLVNLLDLPVYRGYNLNENAIRRARYYFLLRKIHSLEKQYDIGCYYIHYLTNAFQLRDFIEISDKKIFIHCHGYDITWNLRFHHMPEKMYHQVEYIHFCKYLPPNPVLIANSLFSKNLLLEKNLSENRIKVLHFGAPIEGFSELKDNAHVKILYLGRLVDFKGPDLTIVAFEKACEKGLQGELIIAGDGPLMITCQLLKNRSKYAQRIKLLGSVNAETGVQLRKECDIFTAHNIQGRLTNQVETYGVSIIEAMGAGLPVVTGRSGGPEETVLHNKTGFLFNPGDIEQQAEYLLTLANDKKLRKKMGLMAVAHVNNKFSIEKENVNLIKILYD